jgi:hypothetical protein
VPNDKIFELIYKKIDKIITADEESQLNEYFQSNPDAVKEYDSLRNLSGYFQDNEIIPPSDLKIDVMNKVRSINSQKTESVSAFSRFKESIIDWAKPQVAFPFAVGAIAAILITTFIIKPGGVFNSFDSKDLSGTFVFNSVDDAPLDIITKPLEISNGKNYISVSYSQDITVVKVKLETENNTIFDFSVAPESIEFVAFERSSHSNGVITTENDIYTIEQSGNGEYRFFFQNSENRPSVISYLITSDGVNLAEKLYIE